MCRNPIIAHFKGLVKIILYTGVSYSQFITKKIFLGTLICVLYWRTFALSGSAIAVGVFIYAKVYVAEYSPIELVES